MQPLFDRWLQSPKNGTSIRGENSTAMLTQKKESEAEEFKQLRLACLPELILAYNSILNFSSHFAGRQILKTSMDLAVFIAEEDSNLAACLVETGRMPELMDSFAVVAKSMIVAEAKRPGEKNKDGKTLDLWSAKFKERQRHGGEARIS